MHVMIEKENVYGLTKEQLQVETALKKIAANAAENYQRSILSLDHSQA